MPIHDWTRVDAGLFHAFHHGWVVHLCDALNAAGLRSDYFGLIELSNPDPIPDALTRRLAAVGATSDDDEAELYARKADRVTIRHRRGQIVAVIEIVSPGNKTSKAELRAFVEKTSELIERGIHVLVVDLFPPTRRDPQGIHRLIWDELEEGDFELPADKPLTLAAYEADPDWVAYVEPVAVGDVLPDMPLFLRLGYYVPAPLEATYLTTWKAFPAPMKRLLEEPTGNSTDEK